MGANRKKEGSGTLRNNVNLIRLSNMKQGLANLMAASVLLFLDCYEMHIKLYVQMYSGALE